VLNHSTFVAGSSRIATLALILATIGLAPSASAAAPSADACTHAQTQAQITSCVDTEASRADALVEKTYRSIRRDLPARRRTLVDASQRAWRAYRNAECAAVGGAFVGGSIEPTYRASCRADLDKARITALRWQIHTELPLGTTRPSF
jgi:uncharacterized protein YecT (DUF1311 family)